VNARTADRDTVHDIQQFLYAEADMLDDGRFDEWLALFDDGATYYMPTRDVTSERAASVRGRGDLPFFEDDKDFLKARVQRLKGALAHAEDPPSRTRRIVSNIVVNVAEDDMSVVRCNFIVFQSRLERTENFYVGRRVDRLRRDGRSWKIASREILLDHAVIPRTISILL
jgi:dibenzofuran dioxygenase beta subunit